MEKKKKKGGRPKLSDDKLRKHRVTVALTDAELETLKKAGVQYNQPLNVVVRKLALDRKLPKQPTPKLNYQTYVTLTKTGNMLSGLIKQSNKVELSEWLITLKKQLNELRLELLK